MEKKPFVSIVICTHNRAESLDNLTLKSILKLDYSDYEVIIIDDASTDKTKEIVERYQDKINNIRYIKNNKSKGLCYVRNLGVKNSKGEIIAFTDDDCYVHKDWLKELANSYIKDKKVMVVGGINFIKNTKKISNKIIYGCNMSFRKEIFDRFIFDTNIYFNRCSWYDELDLIYRIKNKNLKIYFNKKVKVKHFQEIANYRSYVKLGFPLNFIYVYAKKISLIKYYFLFIKYLFLVYKNLDKKLIKRESIDFGLYKINRIMFSPIGIIPLINRYFNGIRFLFDHKSILKFPYIYYLILFKIPIKAKIKNIIEEKLYKKNTKL